MGGRVRIGIIGGGASGMTAAIVAARNGANVTLLEKNDRVGKKLLMTGNGKCNFSNQYLDTQMYYSDDLDFVRDRLESFGVVEVIRFFRSLGLMIKDKNGYLYPESEQASVVLDVLRFEMDRLGVKVVTGFDVKDIVCCHTDGNGTAHPTYRIMTDRGSAYMEFDRVVIACGGNAAPRTGSDGSGLRLAEKLGHRFTEIYPALVQLRCKGDYFKAIAGVRSDAKVSLVQDGKTVISEYGELQITDYGISGIPVFQISRIAAHLLKMQSEVRVHIDFLPGLDEESYKEFIMVRKLSNSTGTVEEFFTGMLHKKLMQLFIKQAGLKSMESIETADEEKVKRVFALCRDFQVIVTAVNPFENAQVTAGGVKLSEITENFESRIHPGVFLVGELLDVDGKCGGYNLHWAWCSGYLAGEKASL